VWDGSSWQAKAFVYVLARETSLVAAPSAPAPSPSIAALAPMFTVHQGRRYRATLTLSLFEQFAGNDVVASRLDQVGFKDVVATGDGATRQAEGRWTGPDTTAHLDPHITSVVELPGGDAYLGGLKESMELIPAKHRGAGSRFRRTTIERRPP
jgi:hypothetical protein